MKNKLAYSILVALVVCSCQVVEISETLSTNDPEAKVFTAIIEDNASGETRTSLDANRNVLWKQGDQVSIFEGSTINEQYQVSDDSDGKTSASLIKVSGSGFVAGGEIENNVAFYPYISTATIARNEDAYVISDIALPATQHYAEASFGNGAFPMAAVTTSTDDLNLKFKNVLGGVKLQLKGTAKIASVSITGRNNEILCGTAEVTVAKGSTPSISLTDATAKTVTLDCGEGVQLNAQTATSFVIALPPMTMESGFTVVVTDTEGKQMEIETTKSQTINRSKLLKMPEVNYEGVATCHPLTFTSTGETSISLTKNGSPDDVSLEYKVNDGIWVNYTIGDAIPLTDGDKVSFRAGPSGNASFSKSTQDYYNFTIVGSGTVAASGNIMSLLRQIEYLTIPSSYCFYRLFLSCTGLTSAPELPATTLAQRCYLSMFSDCTGLTSAPELPATTLAQYCYYSMFYGCTGLTAAPELPATTLAQRCYHSMFYGCTGLTSAPELPATTLAQNCYYTMFCGCTGLTAAPELPATTLAQSCYSGMFNGCTGLTAAPELPATTLAQSCYSRMFLSCTGLTSAPELPATTLAQNCYGWMFRDCTGLTSAPELPATTLAQGCYSSMFNGCTGLTAAPELPATTLAQSCYNQMFEGCERLNYIKMLATDVPINCTTDWVKGVASTGTFVKNAAATWDITGASGVPSGWTVVMPSVNPLTFTSSGETSISLIKNGSPDDISLEYKVNDGSWTNYTIGDAIALTNGERVSFRAGSSGNSSFSRSYSGYHTFTVIGDGTVAASGSIMSLLNQNGSKTIPCRWCFYQLFDSCTCLTSAPELPATTLEAQCYMGMFTGCTSLTTAPELPATTLADNCYTEMFRGCTGLTSAPKLPATLLAYSCYSNMFYGCTSLTTAPELPATTLSNGCYSTMFRGCTSLTTAPELPATTLADNCYWSMFSRCTSLTSAPELPVASLAPHCYGCMFLDCTSLTDTPELPATTLANGCYSSMFSGCTSLTSAPELPAATLAESCYRYMFLDCLNLSYIKMFATDVSATDCLTNWVSGVASTGTFVKNSAATWDITGASGIPTGWTVITYPPVPEAVDLGLSVKWASFNLGASAPEEYGDYYAWGEIEPKSDYSWETYKWCNGSSKTLTKYNTKTNNGTVDNKTTLDPEDDAAYVNLGGTWRMPTSTEFLELIDNCDEVWTTENGVNGRRFTSKKAGYTDKSIFIPAAGYRSGSALGSAGSDGNYWSSSLGTDYPGSAYYLYFDSSDVGVYYYGGRYFGRPIRPVCP